MLSQQSTYTDDCILRPMLLHITYIYMLLYIFSRILLTVRYSLCSHTLSLQAEHTGTLPGRAPSYQWCFTCMQVDNPRPASPAVVASPTSGLGARPSSEVAASTASPDSGPGSGSVKDGLAAASPSPSRIAKGDYVVILAGGSRAGGPLSVGKYGMVVADDKSPDADAPFMVRDMHSLHETFYVALYLCFVQQGTTTVHCRGEGLYLTGGMRSHNTVYRVLPMDL